MDIVLARALHVMAIVFWIGGLAVVTTVVLPAIRRGDFGTNPIKAFQAFERRFIWQARTAIIIVGASGLYMVVQLNLWSRFHSPAFWWMHAMVGIWLLFAIMLFVVEPFLLHRIFHRWAMAQPITAFAWLHRMHWVLLLMVMITIFGAVIGSHG